MPVSPEELRIHREKEPEPKAPTEWPAWGFTRADDGSIAKKLFVFDSPNYELPAGYHKSPVDVPKKRGRPRKRPTEPEEPADEEEEPEEEDELETNEA